MVQRVATAEPCVDRARRYIEQQVSKFQPKSWWGPVTDAVGLAARLKSETAVMPDGQVRPYFSTDPGGAGLLLRAASENYDAFVLAKHVAASRIYADRPIPAELRDFAAMALTGSFPVPKKDRTAKKRNNWERDVFLHRLARTAQREFGLFRSENEAGSANSGLSAMALILDACRAGHNPELRYVTEHMVREAIASKRIQNDLRAAAASVGPWLLDCLERAFGDAWGDFH